jgi:molybdopterin synthase sulfur carrier subunit
MINVLFFAQLKELLNCASVQLEQDTLCNVNDVKQALIAQNPAWQVHLIQDNILCAVNQTMVNLEHTIKDGDEVAFFPPVTGG